MSRSVPECARFREQAARIAVALFADTAKLLLPPARALPRHEPDLGREIPRRVERLRICDAGNQSRGQRRTNTRNLIEPPARLAGSVPSIDHTVKFQDPQLEQPELGADRGNRLWFRRLRPFLQRLSKSRRKGPITERDAPSCDQELKVRIHLLPAESPLRTQFGQRRLADEKAARVGVAEIALVGRFPSHDTRAGAALWHDAVVGCRRYRETENSVKKPAHFAPSLFLFVHQKNQWEQDSNSYNNSNSNAEPFMTGNPVVSKEQH